MTSRQQFDVLWKSGCKHAAIALVNNAGKPLTEVQIRHHIRIAAGRGQVYHVMRLAEMSRTAVSYEIRERLVKRCLKLGWVVNATYVLQLGNISTRTRKRLIDACIKNGIATSVEEAQELLAP